MKLVLLISLFAFTINANADDCAGYKKVTGYNSDIKESCLGLVATKDDVPWSIPRKILFKDSKTLLITDMGGWGTSKGKVWSLNVQTMAVEMVYSGGRETHGLAIDSQSRILIGNSNEIVRMNNLEDKNPQRIISNLPTAGKHPLSHFILLPNNDLVLNIGAPSDSCKKVLKERVDPLTGEKLKKGHCPTRDREAEIRIYTYNDDGSYDPNYTIPARGLRNSMALLYNPKINNLYQAENNIDVQGTVEEFNDISLDDPNTADFGWPFCYGFNQQTFNSQNSKIKALGLANTYKGFCDKIGKAPLFNIPAHSSPLDMNYYKSNAFPDIKGSIIMTWHGHRRPEGHQNSLVAYPTDENGHPIVTSETNNNYIKLLSGKNPENGQKIRPVGLTTDADGNIWMIDDKAIVKGGPVGRLYILAPSKDGQGGNFSGPTFSQKNQDYIDQMDSKSLEDFSKIYKNFHSTQTCDSCHNPKVISENPRQALHELMNKNWITPGVSADQMPLIERMDPSQKGKASSMPLDNPYGISHPENFEALKDWLENNFSQ